MATIAWRQIGTRTVNGTDWPIKDEVQRWNTPSGRPQWLIVFALCNGVPDSVRSYRTRREALDAFARLAR